MKLKYKDARALIIDGDLVAVINPQGIFGYATQFFTRSKYTHVGIAIWLGDGLYLAELNSGRNHFIPLSQLEGVKFDVYTPPYQLVDIRSAVFKWMREPIDYSFLASAVIGLRSWLGIKASINWKEQLVCSGWCMAVYQEDGMTRYSRVVSPAELVKLFKLKFNVRN